MLFGPISFYGEAKRRGKVWTGQSLNFWIRLVTVRCHEPRAGKGSNASQYLMPW